MRHIVLEGPDNGGKSTLARFLAQRLRTPILHSGGPEKEPGEINKRIRTFLDLKQQRIFDRHACISQEIYRTIRNTNNGAVDPALIAEFYDSKPLLIYCRPLIEELGAGHVVKSDHDTEQHLVEIKENYQRLLVMYDAWALQHSNLIYRIGDSYEPVAGYVWGYKSLS
jgi:adenylate kinase family enzyme